MLAIYNKPFGVHSTVGDPRSRDNLSLVLQSHPFLKILHPVGRLDADSSGLLLFSKEGSLTNFLLHPKFHVPKEYAVIVTGKVDEEDLRSKLAAGVKISIGTFKMKLIASQSVSGREASVS